MSTKATFLAMVRVRRLLNAARGKPLRVLPKPLPIPYPVDLEHAYERDMQRVTDPMWALTAAKILPLIPAMIAEEKRGDTRMDKDDDPSTRFRQRLEELRIELNERLPIPQTEADGGGQSGNGGNIAADAAERGNRRNREEVSRQVKQVLGIDIIADSPKTKGRVESFVTENVKLIKSIPDRYFDEVERLVISGVQSGRRVEDISSDVLDRFSVAESRSRLIARDQVGKLNGQLTKVRHEAVGVTEYVWQTAGDGRVRDEHAARDGKTFSYNSPPADGNPGEPIQCRCTALPKFNPALYQ